MSVGESVNNSIGKENVPSQLSLLNSKIQECTNKIKEITNKRTFQWFGFQKTELAEEIKTLNKLVAILNPEDHANLIDISKIYKTTIEQAKKWNAPTEAYEELNTSLRQKWDTSSLNEKEKNYQFLINEQLNITKTKITKITKNFSFRFFGYQKTELEKATFQLKDIVDDLDMSTQSEHLEDIKTIYDKTIKPAGITHEHLEIAIERANLARNPDNGWFNASDGATEKNKLFIEQQAEANKAKDYLATVTIASSEPLGEEELNHLKVIGIIQNSKCEQLLLGVDGKELKKILLENLKKKLTASSPSQEMLWAKQILEELQQLHNIGLSYNSLNAKNIVFKEKSVKLADFTKSELIGPDNKTSKDIYDFGIVFLEMTTGITFSNNSVLNETDQKILPKRAEEILLLRFGKRNSTILLDIINRCLDNNPENRPLIKELITQISKIKLDPPTAKMSHINFDNPIKRAWNDPNFSNGTLQIGSESLNVQRMGYYEEADGKKAEKGKGGFGVILQSNDKKHAIKILNPIKRKIKSVRKEEEITSLIGKDKKASKYLLGASSVGRNGNLVFIKMPYMKGGDLFDALRKQPPLSLKQKTSYCVDILRGLEALHEMGFIHKDLKLENVLLDDAGAKIADFGLCERFGDEQRYSGTKGYMAPEVVALKQPKTDKSPDENYTKAVDVYSFGVLLEKLFQEELTASDATINEIKKIIESCKSKHSKDRPAIETLIPCFSLLSMQVGLDVLSL
jgi:serine/threonine protein kinase